MNERQEEEDNRAKRTPDKTPTMVKTHTYL